MYPMYVYPKYLYVCVGVSHLLHGQIDAPDDQDVGRLLAHQLGVIQQELLAVLITAQHPKLLGFSLVLLNKLCL